MLDQAALVDDQATEPLRKITILDAMILVAVTALGWPGIDGRSKIIGFMSLHSDEFMGVIRSSKCSTLHYGTSCPI
jgi:hypothetical protein